MTEQFSTFGKAALAGFVASLLMDLNGHAGAYLPITGPTPLRFETVATIAPSKLLTLATPSIVQKKIEEASPLAVAAPPNVPEAVAPSNLETNVTPPTVTSEPEATEIFSAHNSANNLVVITPQMLADYFRPFPNGTNAAGVSVLFPFPMGFTPPIGKPTVSSRATYKVQ